MSVHTRNRPVPLFSLSPEADSTEAAPALPTERVDGFMLALRQLETALRDERRLTAKLRAELKQTHALYDQLLKEAQARAQELGAGESKLKAALGEYRSYARKLRSRHEALAGGYRSLRAELQRYQAAWAGVLQREKEAKQVLAENERAERKAQELQRRLREQANALSVERAEREQVERHAKSYQLELQNALVRLHSAESKFNELAKEHQVLSLSRRNMDREVARIQESMRERMELEVAKEKEKLRVELERDASEERERYREMLRRTLRAELERELEQERLKAAQAREAADGEVAAMRAALVRAQASAKEAKEETESVRQQLSDRLAEACQALDEARRESAALEERVAEAQQGISAVRDEAARLREDLDLAAAREAEAEELKRRLEVSGQEARDQAEELVRERTRASELQRRLDELRCGGESREKEVAGLREELDRVRAESAGQREEAERQRETARKSSEEAAVEKARAESLDLAVERLVAQAEGFEMAFSAEVARSRSLEEALVAEKERFESLSDALEHEVERLRALYPVRDLLKAKELEIDRLESRRGELTPVESAEAARIDASLATAASERDRLAALVREAERRLDAQSRRILRARQINTWLAEPGMEC